MCSNVMGKNILPSSSSLVHMERKSHSATGLIGSTAGIGTGCRELLCFGLHKEQQFVTVNKIKIGVCAVLGSFFFFFFLQTLKVI